MGIRENKQAFQYALPYEQVFQAAMAAVPSVPKATMMGADMNARPHLRDAPDLHVLGRAHHRRLYPSPAGRYR